MSPRPKAAALLFALSATPTFGAIGEAARPDPVAREVAARFAEGETLVPVVVLLHPEPEREAGPPGFGRAPSTEPLAWREARDRFAASLPEGAVAPRHLYGNVAAFSARVTRAGLDELRRRPEVRAVTLDGRVFPADSGFDIPGQVGTAQIGADLLLSLGVTGTGRSIAVVDSGIDGGHPDFASSAGGSRLLGGWNFVDGSADLSDCGQHGTAVAGVAAGPQGVAPDAGLVALKVFSVRDGCSSAAFSDVMAAVDHAITNRDRFRLDAVNLSLADLRWRSGYCDAEDPAAAALFAKAREAGLAVVVASGNDAKSGALAWPACFSDVTSVGMVYSAAVGATSWGGIASCTDLVTGPDVIPCASNSGTGLSLLAPGVRWVTPKAGGGRLSLFSGTSAAAPAAAGAIVLSRQARVLRDPALAVDLLRSTGVPVLDTRSGRLSPRVDAAAALGAATPQSGPCDEGRDIPDGTLAPLECDLVVSSLVGAVSSVAVSLSIDHPDPTQLVVTLSGPDGATVNLMNRSGRAGYAVREVFGRTSTSGQPLSNFAGRPAAGRWRLQIFDTTAGQKGKLVSWALQIEPEVPRAPSQPPQATVLFPTSVNRPGKFGSFFKTDVRLFNPGPGSADVQILFAPAGRDGTENLRSVSITLPARATRALDDVIGNAFRTFDYGPLFLVAPPQVVAAARIQSTAPGGGSFGLFVPPALPTRAVALGGTPALLALPFRADAYRVNLGLAEVTGAGATAEILVKNARGALRGALDVEVPALSSIQVNGLYDTLGILGEETDRYEVRVVSGAGKVIPFVSGIDNRTNDGVYSGPMRPRPDLLLPAAAHAPGRFGAFFRTDVKLTNPLPRPISVKVSYFPLSGPTFEPRVVGLGPGETLVVPDVLDTLFSPAGDAAGALRLTALDGETVTASSRTYTDAPGGGSYGLAIEPPQGEWEATPGRKMALTFLAGSADVRTNVGFLETSGRDTIARFTLLSPSGETLATRDLGIPARTAIQWNDVFAELDAKPIPDASALVEVLSGGSLAAHAIQLDNRTNDAGFLPAVLLP